VSVRWPALLRPFTSSSCHPFRWAWCCGAPVLRVRGLRYREGVGGLVISVISFTVDVICRVSYRVACLLRICLTHLVCKTVGGVDIIGQWDRHLFVR
jgi:hypothetical protein